MSFNTDKQTLNDLNILEKAGADSIFKLFNNTRTRGGSDILQNMFLFPMSDKDAINDRSRTIQYFKNENIAFPFKADELDSAEIYLAMTDERTRLAVDEDNLRSKIFHLLAADGDYKMIYNGVLAIVAILKRLNDFVNEIDRPSRETPYRVQVDEIKNLLAIPDLAFLIDGGIKERLPYNLVASTDNLLRFKYRTEIKKLLASIYNMDVFITVAETAVKNNYSFPIALNTEGNYVALEGVYHPLVKNAVPNSIAITPESNIVFLTGANMAGKSTFMKSFAVAMYLAHMGFPVAAEKMEFSARDGMYTTINLPDDLNSGNSHFYAEVLRVKKITQALAEAKKLFIVFDELFRGTNVKDAYEGTIAITEGFARKTNCMCVISTHIIESADVLKQECENISFLYLPTLMNKNNPVYTYKIEQGITSDRHGMVIINNERIVEQIRAKKNSAAGCASFYADKQTLDDLNITDRHKTNSIFRLFDKAVTTGGKALMHEMFQRPLTDADVINERSDNFEYFTRNVVVFPFTENEFSVIENYLRGSEGNLIATGFNIISLRITQIALQDNDYGRLKNEVLHTIEMLKRFHGFITGLNIGETPFAKQIALVRAIFESRRMQSLLMNSDHAEMPLFKLIQNDHLLRTVMRSDMRIITETIYMLDVCIAVAEVIAKRGFCFARALPKAKNTFTVRGIYHPALINPIGNTVGFDAQTNVLFLTGANMAGKSTLMKSLGIATYLAHMGFPVAASSMEFSVKDGLFTSVNVPDNLSMGYSHFYAEVLRVKMVAEQVAEGKDLIVIFDELFKGTNVKDAYDATLSITEAFAENRNSFFVISTHIIEVGETLKAYSKNFRFRYLPTVMEGAVPRYTYQLAEGITTDRQGMIIIENEGILKLLKEA